MDQLSWGHETKMFLELTPDRVLDAFEQVTGLRATGRTLIHNSMENRVYELEIDCAEPKTRYDRFRVVKFYRPGRWNFQQIKAEHDFIFDLLEDEIPVVAPLRFDGESLFTMDDTGLYFCVYDKVGGRTPSELEPERLAICGRLLARLHLVGGKRPAPERMRLSPYSYGTLSLEALLAEGAVPLHLVKEYEEIVTELLEAMTPYFESIHTQRIHGDCHLGNILWSESGPQLFDFDDFLMGPAVQDMWLLVGGRDDAAKKAMHSLLRAYESLKEFDERELLLIEPLRTLRFLHFSIWIHKRWRDPAFSRAFSQFGDERYWQGQLADLREQREFIVHKPRYWLSL